MKITILIVAFGAALLLAPPTTTRAQSTWQTVADFPAAPFTAVDALAKDAAGNLYAAVSTSDAEGRMHAVIRKSSDKGATWTVIEDFAARGSARFLSLGADAASQLYAVGYSEDERGQMRWIVRRSGKGGNSWTTVDDFSLPGGRTTVAEGFAADAIGNLYVAGHGTESPSDGSVDSRRHWLVRQSRDGGRSWSTIDDFSHRFSAKAAAVVNTGNGLFVAGSAWNGKPESGEHWLVRKGTNDDAGGFRWQTVDEFQMEAVKHGFDSRVRGLGVDGRGNLYAVGQSYTTVAGTAGANWIVRRASSAGLDWTVVDRFQLDPGSFAAARGVAASGQAGIFVVGQAFGSQPGCHWIVRRSATGEAGSWSVSDDFRPASPPLTASMTASLIVMAAEGSAASPAENASGCAILNDSTRVLAGGSGYAGVGHAIVRKLETERASALTAAIGR